MSAQISTDAATGRSPVEAVVDVGGPRGRGRSRAHAQTLFVLRRLAYGVVTVFAVTVLVFIATQALPGDPARSILGNTATPDRVAALRSELGLNRPLVVQYFSWVGGLLHGDLGNSIVGTRGPVGEAIAGPLVNSLILVLLAGAFTIVLGILIGAYAGARRDGAFDAGFMGVSIFLTALPEFVIGLILLILFSTTVLRILPAIVVIGPGQSPLSQPVQLVLPIATLVLAGFPYLARLTRGSVVEAYDSEYVRMARLKGTPERVILRRHVLPNALVPTIQGSTLSLAYLTGGTVVVEYLFNYPGLGRALTDAVSNRDLAVVQAITLIFAIAYVVFNLLGDIITVYVTPRLRTDQS